MKKLQVVGIGNAMVDILAECDETFLLRHQIQKGIMQLIDMDRAVALYGTIGPAKEVSGGSAANTIAGIAKLGGRTAYVGKVKDDLLGAVFAQDLRAQGAGYETKMAPATDVAETGRCIVIVTPDGERSMNTYLGVTEFLSPDDIDLDLMASTEWIYLEGYRFDGPESHAAFAKAIDATKAAGGKVSLTLSDPFCIDRHRDAFRQTVSDHVDLLFCNRAEALSMYQVDDFDAALRMAASDVEIVACTDGENGCHILHDGQHHNLPAVPTKIVDATGAGDMFAAGFLWGITNGATPEVAGKMGNVAASEVISHIGARAHSDLKSLFREHGLA